MGGFSKTLRKIFKTRKKKDREDDEGGGVAQNGQGGVNFNRGRSMRGGIYEPYRQHFPLKSQNATDYGSYAGNYPTVAGFNDNQQQAFGPKLITGDQPTNNYSYHQLGPNGQVGNGRIKGAQAAQGGSNYETRSVQGARVNRTASDASVCSYRPYQMYNPAQRYGSNMSLNQTNGTDAYENHLPSRRPARANSMNFNSQYEQYQPGRGLTRQGSLSSIPQMQGNYPNIYSRPRRPSSAVAPSRSMSDAGSFAGFARPGRPSSAQGSCLQLDQSQNYESVASSVMSPPMSEYSSSLNSSFIHNQSQRVMSPIGSTYGMSPMCSSASSFDVQQQSTFALHQLRSSQANLQQALRVQEDLSRQGGNVKPAELDATMKIMQTCLDMLDSISGLVERSSTPQPQSLAQFGANLQQPHPQRALFEHNLGQNTPPKKNFINHQKGLKPIKSALKQRIPTTTSAFETIQKNNQEIKEASPGLSDSSEGFYGSGSQDESNSGIESPALSQTSPGPSVLSEDSGYGLPMNHANPMPDKVVLQTKPDEEAKNSPSQSLKPMLSSLSQLKIGSSKKYGSCGSL
jgi:hypothetical protein